MSSDKPNLREILGKNLSLIRFPTIPVDDFNNVVIPFKILTSDEEQQVLAYISGTSRPEKFLFQTVHHRQLQEIRFSETIKIIYDLPRSSGETKSTTLKCRISKPIHLTKLFVAAGAVADWISCYLKVSLKQNGNVLYSYQGIYAHQGSRQN